ncbi:MAG TPA: sugar-binding protein, partial [bacterium]|nr:sugar-binding protein [bacterium]
ALTTLTNDGYSAEFKIKKASVFTPADITTIGFDIAINEDDSDPAAEKDTGFQITWDGYPHDEASYGDLVLGPAVVDVADWNLY